MNLGFLGAASKSHLNAGGWSALGSGAWVEAARQWVRWGQSEAGICWLSVERAVGFEIEEEKGCLQGSVLDILNLVELSQNPGKDY